MQAAQFALARLVRFEASIITRLDADYFPLAKLVLALGREADNEKAVEKEKHLVSLCFYPIEAF